MRFVLHYERGALTFQRHRGAGHAFNHLPSVVVDDRLVDVESELLLHVGGDQRGEEGEGIACLVVRDSGDLHPRVVLRLANRLAFSVEMRKFHRSKKLCQRQRADQRVLAPTLHAPQSTRAVDKPTVRVYSIPPEDETSLFHRGHERLARIRPPRGKYILVKPVQDTPAEGALGKNPIAVLVSGPRRADKVRCRHYQPLVAHATLRMFGMEVVEAPGL